MALLLLIDLALALLGRMQQQLHLLSLSFPVKMLAALAMLVALAPVIARMFEGAADADASSALWSVGDQPHGRTASKPKNRPSGASTRRAAKAISRPAANSSRPSSSWDSSPRGHLRRRLADAHRAR